VSKPIENTTAAIAPATLSPASSALAVIAALVLAALLLVAIVLPAEYSLDPLGSGRALGLLGLADGGNEHRVELYF